MSFNFIEDVQISQETSFILISLSFESFAQVEKGKNFQISKETKIK